MPVAISSRLPGERAPPPRAAGLPWLEAAAVGVPVVILGARGVLVWWVASRDAERELIRSADAVGEYVLRVLDGHRVAGDRINDLLEHLSNEQIQVQEGELHARLARLLPDLPLVQTIAVLRADGLLLLTANVHPVPRDSYFADREWVRELKSQAAPRTHVSKVHVGRLDANLFFGVSRRRVMAERSGAADAYEGVINIAVEPNSVAAGFADLVIGPTDKVAVIRADGEVLAQQPGFARPLPPLQPTREPAFFAYAAAAGGDRSAYAGTFRGDDGVVAMRRLQGFPVVATVSRDRAAIAAQWWHDFSKTLVVGVPAIGLIAVMAMFAWRRGEADRAQAAARFHAVFDATPVGLAVIDSASGAVVVGNSMLAQLAGAPPDPAAELPDLRGRLTQESLSHYDAAIAQAQQTGAGGPVDVELAAAPQPIPVRLWCSSLPGEPPRLVVVAQDISELRETEARRNLIMREVQHRSKNTLALFQAALRLGASGTSDAQELAKAVEARVVALARAQALSDTVGEKGAALRELIVQELEPFVADRAQRARPPFTLDGGELRVTARASQPLSMAFHELATNAAKYGALARPDGSIAVNWKDHGSHAVIDWTERGGRARARGVKRAGFGTRLIDTSIRGLGGAIRRNWQRGHLACEITLPRDQVFVAHSGE